jgi:hypothetical protein
MINAAQIKEQMEVKGSDGKHVGTVDLDAVDEVKEGVVRLKKTAQEATKPWH